MTFGQQDTEKEKFEKIQYESLFKHESSSEEEMSYSYPGKTASESTHITKHPGEKVYVKNRIYGMKEMMGKQFWGKNQAKNEEEYFGSTGEPQDPNVNL